MRRTTFWIYLALLAAGEAANWFPVTRISHMLDCQLFGLASGWRHLTNVAVHALATLLLFSFLHLATQARWPSAFVALVFALHPLHVESVAWSYSLRFRRGLRKRWRISRKP